MRARFRARSAAPSTAPDVTTAGPASQLAEALDTTSGRAVTDGRRAIEGGTADVGRAVGRASLRRQPARLADPANACKEEEVRRVIMIGDAEAEGLRTPVVESRCMLGAVELGQPRRGGARLQVSPRGAAR